MRTNAKLIVVVIVLVVVNGFEVNEETNKDEMLCRKCGHGITKPKQFTDVPTVKALRQRNDTILMRENTLIQLFQNPEGSKFEVITAKETNVKLVGEPTKEYSWFPGFSWTIAICPHCGIHLGWKFDPIDGDEDDDFNFSFVGLILSRIIGSSCECRFFVTHPKIISKLTKLCLFESDHGTWNDSLLNAVVNNIFNHHAGSLNQACCPNFDALITYCLTFCPEIGLFKMGLLFAKSNGYSLTFCPEIGLFKIGLIFAKSKGYSLTFCPEIVHFKMGLNFAKSKGYSLTFCPEIVHFKMGLIFAKSKGYSLTFCPEIQRL
eukprot:Seg539.8 transcript_id=Seg539.8/GoldUCD/mRNA.D3Y31 product="Protein cereblon" protein_id=Seg539.8/GoldUCD/D3Y31